MSLQIIHEPIVISANGFFNINFTLLGSMSAAVRFMHTFATDFPFYFSAISYNMCCILLDCNISCYSYSISTE